MSGPMLRVEGVRTLYGKIVALRGVDLDVNEGEIVTLIGANGAGKSTLMNAIGGYVPSSGTVELLGRPVDGLAPHRRAALGLGRTFQDAALYGDLTVRETVQVAVETRARARLVPVVLSLPRAGREPSARGSPRGGPGHRCPSGRLPGRAAAAGAWPAPVPRSPLRGSRPASCSGSCRAA